MTYTKPRPNIDDDIAPFWEGVNDHRFLLCHCRQCDQWYWPMAFCQRCEPEPFGENMHWDEASGRGEIFVFNVHHIAFDPSFEEDVPYVFAMIELEEGPMFGTNLIGCDPAEVQIGAPVEIVFENHEDGVTLPKARLVR